MYPHHLHHGPTARTIPYVRPLPPEMQRIEIILLRSELIHDIEAGIALLEKSKSTVPGDSVAGSILPTGGADNYLMARYIDNAVNQAVARCQAYLLLPSPFVHRISTDHANQWEEKSIYLAMPPGWPPHCIDPLRDAIHNYIVYSTMQRLIAFSDEKAAAMSDSMATSCYNEINALLNNRLGPTHIHPTFLG